MGGPSEMQRMLAGAPYRASDPELVAGQARAWALLREFNAADSAEVRQALLTRIFGALGRGAQVKPLFACDYGYNIRAGANLFVNFNCVRIGDDAVAGAGCVVARDLPSGAVAAGNPCRVIRQPVRPA